MLLHIPGMLPLLAITALTFAGFSLLLPISPSWLISAGATELEAGSVTTVLMLFTILAQIATSRVIRRYGWSVTITTGLVLLSVPSPLQAASANLEIVLLSSALRGLGFGFLTVCGSAALALITPAEQRGKAVGLYGLAASLPQLVCASFAPTFAQAFGDKVILVSGAVSILGLLWVSRLAHHLPAAERQNSDVKSDLKIGEVPILAILPALGPLFVVTLAGGAVFTFATQIAPSSQSATMALLILTAFSLFARWTVGAMSDVISTRSVIPLLTVASAVSGILLGVSTVSEGATAALVGLFIGTALLGIAFGGLQSATLLRALDIGGTHNAARVSAAWNMTFDFGFGVGAIIFGLIAQQRDFMTALVVTAMISLMPNFVDVANVLVRLRGKSRKSCL